MKGRQKRPRRKRAVPLGYGIRAASGGRGVLPSQEVPTVSGRAIGLRAVLGLPNCNLAPARTVCLAGPLAASSVMEQIPPDGAEANLRRLSNAPGHGSL